jgi:hypothetical protein
MALKWKGDKMKARMEMAAKIGINETMGEGVFLAKETHPFTNRTGTAERSIRIVAAAARAGGGLIRGIWGSIGVVYFKWLELGTEAMDHRVRAATSRTPGRVPVWSGAKSGMYEPTLRPVARMTYPGLKQNIRDAWERLG